jgi:hypothetical protein
MAKGGGKGGGGSRGGGGGSRGGSRGGGKGGGLSKSYTRNIGGYAKNTKDEVGITQRVWRGPEGRQEKGRTYGRGEGQQRAPGDFNPLLPKELDITFPHTPAPHLQSPFRGREKHPGHTWGNPWRYA